MAISRPQRSRWPLAAGALVAGLLAGLLIGLAAGGGGDGESAEDGLREMRSSLEQAGNLLDVMRVEYEESVRGGRIVSGPEYRGARSALRRSREEYRNARATLVLANPSAPAALDDAYASLDRLVVGRAAPSRVDAAAQKTERLLSEATGAG